MEVRRGDIWYVEKSDDTVGHEQRSGRPAIVVSSEEVNRGGTVEVVYLTTKPKPASEMHVSVFACNKISTALCEQVTTVDKRRLKRKNGTVCKGEMERIDRAIEKSLGIYAGETVENELPDLNLGDQITLVEPGAEIWKAKYELMRDCYMELLERMAK